MTRCDSARPRGLARLISISSRARLSVQKFSAPKAALLRLAAALGLAVTVAHAQASPPAGHRSFPLKAFVESCGWAHPLWRNSMSSLNGWPQVRAFAARTTCCACPPS